MKMEVELAEIAHHVHTRRVLSRRLNPAPRHDHGHNHKHPQIPQLPQTITLDQKNHLDSLKIFNQHNGPPPNPPHTRPSSLAISTPHRPHTGQSRRIARRNSRHRCRRERRCCFDARRSSSTAPKKDVGKKMFANRFTRTHISPLAMQWRLLAKWMEI
jgi:hypothetical protein